MNTPKFLLLEKHTDLNCDCTRCGRPIKHTYIVKETSNGTIHKLGTGCVKKITGKVVHELATESEKYKIEQEKLFEIQQKEARVDTFRELNVDMMKFIEHNKDGNEFLESIFETIEYRGTLTHKQHEAVEDMMMPKASLPDKFTNMKFKPIRLKSNVNRWGYYYTLLGEVGGKRFRIHMTDINKKHASIFNELEIETDKDLSKLNLELYVSGSFDGYKVKRARIDLPSVIEG